MNHRHGEKREHNGKRIVGTYRIENSPYSGEYHYYIDDNGEETEYHTAYDSSITPEQVIPLAMSVFCPEQRIYCVQQDILVIISDKQVRFLDGAGKLLLQEDLPPVTEGRKEYLHVYCSGNEKQLSVAFPLYRWEDYYPHCDGEFDRWDATIIGYHPPITYVLDRETVE